MGEFMVRLSTEFSFKAQVRENGLEFVQKRLTFINHKLLKLVEYFLWRCSIKGETVIAQEAAAWIAVCTAQSSKETGMEEHYVVLKNHP